MLNGIKVLDLSRVLAGPYCTQMLGDLGADVWKVESPKGDETRAWGPPYLEGESTYYLSVNRNKRSIVVDLKNPEGVALVRELAGKADVLVENFKTGDLERYGLGYEQLKDADPRLIYTSITGFGHTGPRANEPGYDAAIQGMSGLMAMTGEADGPPTKLGVAWVDVLTGSHAATAIMGALFQRERTGQGRHIDISLLDVTMAAMVNQGQAALATGKAPAKLGTGHPSIVPYQALPTKEGWLSVAVGNDRQFERFAGALGLAELARDERFATNSARVAHRDELIPRLKEVLITRTRDEWLELLGAAGVPAAPVNTLPEALEDAQLKARGMIAGVGHSLLGDLPMIQSPYGPALNEQLPRSAPPLLGEHTRELLGEQLSLDQAAIDELVEQGAVSELASQPEGLSSPS